MPLKDFVPEYRTLARFAGYLALAAAVAAPVYLSNKEYRRQIRDLREAVERLEDSRGTDQKNVRDFLDRYVGVVERQGKELEGHGRRMEVRSKELDDRIDKLSEESLFHKLHIQGLQNKVGVK